MRKLFREFFYVPKYGKVREKVMLTQVAVSIVIIVMCLAAMSLSAYAFFSYNVTSGSNIIGAANFETNIAIQITDNNGTAININPITSNYQTHKAEGLEPGKYYTVTITPTEKSTATTGFVVVTADGCKDIYHTQQLGVDKNVAGGKTDSVSFKLMLTDETDVIFLAHWGTSFYYDIYKDKGDSEEFYITQDEEIKMTVNAPAVNTGKESGSTTPPTSAATGTNATSAQTSDSTIPHTETTKPEDNTTPETTGTSEPTSAAAPSVTATEPSATQPTETAETAATEPTETTATETTETTVTEATEQTQPTEETTGALATEASEYNEE